MVQIEMNVTTYPNEVTEFKITLLRDHSLQSNCAHIIKRFSGHPLFGQNRYCRHEGAPAVGQGSRIQLGGPFSAAQKRIGRQSVVKGV
jgi:hypothetical protein